MTKEEKQLRKHRRCEKRRARNRVDKKQVFELMKEENFSFSEAKSYLRDGYFYSDNGERMMICNYIGYCSWPCNGDC